MAKERLDLLLVSRGLFPSREKAKSAIMAGVVYINQQKEDKPGALVPEDCEAEVRESVHPYVSRGGLKLEKAMKTFEIRLDGKVTMDIGASTGGFTDCMLQNGAVKVYAVDVGYGQLAWELRNDPRVVCMERTNIRYVKPEQLAELVDFASVDVSFISLSKVLPAAKDLLRDAGEMVCLVKPQFEAGREKVGKHGVVREPETHREVIRASIATAQKLAFQVKGLTFSPIRGPEGNIEYLLYLAKSGEDAGEGAWEERIAEVVAKSHEVG